jgi:cation diffusion facilitator family transporter
MFSQLLIKKFVKNYDNIKNEKVRTMYGFVVGVIGIFINLLLFITKLSVGIITHSIAATADAFNNLSDSGSSLITIIGFKLSNIPADEEHPFGHGRIEYLSALLVSFMVMLVGYEFIRSSFDRILHPTAIKFQLIPFILILLSILIKIWLSKFNGYIGKVINSSALKASSFDSFGDVITSSCIALSLLASKFTSFPIDGYLGIAVALLILYTGFKLVKETIDPILGSSPDSELVNAIKSGLLSYEYISGVHDLIIHSYGPNKYMASIHAEVPSDINIVKIHDIIDTAEKELATKLNILLVIHMDPITVNNVDIRNTKDQLMKVLDYFSIIKSVHDFRVVGEGARKNLIFDVVVDSSKKLNQVAEEELKTKICNGVKTSYPDYNCIITIDRDFNHL